jgi:hypothetical protein
MADELALRLCEQPFCPSNAIGILVAAGSEAAQVDDKRPTCAAVVPVSKKVRFSVSRVRIPGFSFVHKD